MYLILRPLSFIPISQSSDNLSESKQRLININTLLRQLPFRARLPDPLRPSQIHQFQPTRQHIIRIPMIKALHPNTKYTMTSGGCNVKFVGAVDSVFEPIQEVLVEFLGGFTLEDE